MAELFDLNSSNTLPTRFIAIIDGALSGLIDTDRSFPTSSSWGTIAFSTTMIAIQPRMIGTASTRMVRGMKVLFGTFTAGMASVGGSLREGLLMPTSPGSRCGHRRH